MIPKWLDKRYEILWEAFHSSPFRFEEASTILKEKIDDSEEQINVVLSELRKKGMLKVEFDPNDVQIQWREFNSSRDIVLQNESSIENYLRSLLND